MLSSTASDKLFGPAPQAVGRTIETRKHTFTVVGVVGRAGGFGGGRRVRRDLRPLHRAAGRAAASPTFTTCCSRSKWPASRHACRRTSSGCSAARHRLGPDDPDDFTVKPQARDAVVGKGLNPMLARAVMGSVVDLDKVTLEEMARTLERSSRTMTVLLSSVAACRCSSAASAS